RAGNHEHDSEFIYTRHLVQGKYLFGHEKNKLFLSFLAGTISGNAPLFERFSLGDTSTLRGWSKFDVSPLGGNRVVHATLQYGVGGRTRHLVFSNDQGVQTKLSVGLHAFYDVRAVGDGGSPIKARHSVGFGFGPGDSSSFFLEIGFPIRSSHVQP